MLRDIAGRVDVVGILGQDLAVLYEQRPKRTTPMRGGIARKFVGAGHVYPVLGRARGIIMRGGRKASIGTCGKKEQRRGEGSGERHGPRTAINIDRKSVV